MSLSYAYQVYLNYDWAFRPAVQVSHTWRDVDIAQLTFGDQFDPRTGQIVNPTGEPLSDLSARFFDVNLGGLLFSNKAWAGDFLRVIKNCWCLIGNSSVGIRECSYLGVPVVNIGSRQSGRERGMNVIDVNYQSKAIREAILQQIEHGPYTKEEIYGDGAAGKKIADLLAELPLTFHKILNY